MKGMCDYKDTTDTSADEEEDGISNKTGADRARKKSSAIMARPTSAGYWLCCLLPIALAVQYIILGNNCTPPATYKMLAIAAAGMCVESLCFFMYMFLDTALLIKLLISFLPGMLTTFLYMTLLEQSWKFGLFWGFAVTFCYQNVYIRVMRRLPRCFSYGEAAVLVQGLMLFVLNAILQLPTLWFTVSPSTVVDFSQLNVIMMSALLYLLVACWLLATFKCLRQPVVFYILMIILVIAVTCIPIGERVPINTLLNFIVEDRNRLYILCFYLCLAFLTFSAVFLQLVKMEKASTRLRKVFHLIVVLVYVPGLLYQCALLYIGTGVALALFTVIELFRIMQMPPIEQFLKNAFTSFSDEKDAGILALTPFCLLIGFSLPIWISPCPCSSDMAVQRSGTTMLPLMAGVLSIGFGDSAASVIGSKFGRVKWRNSSRTLEGSLAFIVAVILAVFTLNYTGYIPMTHFQGLLTIAATLTTALTEAYTDQIDNLVLPLIFYIIVSFG